MNTPGVSTTETPRPIRFGILCDSLHFQAWHVRCIDTLLAVPNTSLALLVQAKPAAPARRNGVGPVDRTREPGSLLFTLYRRHFIKPRAYLKQNLSVRLTDVPVLQVSRRAHAAADVREADVEAIRQHDLDFLLLFSAGPIRGQILETTRFGVWSFHQHDALTNRGLLPCFWAIYNGDRVTGATLQRLTERGGVVLKRGVFRVIQHSLSKSKDSVYFGSSIWPAEVVQDIRNGACAYLEAPPSGAKTSRRRRPNSRQTMVFVARLWKNKLKHLFHTLFRQQQWNIGIAEAPIAAFLKEKPPPIQWFPRLPRDTFYADPFGLQSQDRLYVLFEEYRYTTKKGRIAVVEMGEGLVSPAAVDFDHPGHLSYPYLFEWNGEIYCIPENPQVREIALYKALRFPTEWQKETVILDDFAAVDSTVFQYEGRWWLLCSSRDHDGANSRLYAFYAPALEGPWLPHRANPVKMDVRSSRPGGTPFFHNGHLYRPAQNSSVSYGGSLALNKVITLTPEAFQEEVVASIQPDATSVYRHGIHTLAAIGDKTLVDGKRYVYSLRLLRDLPKVLMRRKTG